jgi:hypothetical protein
MSGVKTVVIHQIQESMTNLEDTIEYFRPDYVFLLSCVHNIRDKPDFALMELQRKSVKSLGEDVKYVEYSELIGIDEAWHKSTMMDVFQALGDIKRKCEELAGNNRCEYYAGLSDGPSLMTVGISFAAVLHDMKTYFTRGRRSYYHGEYVIEIENLNKITETKNWLESKAIVKRNLRYLRMIIELEERGEREITSAKLAEELAPITQKAVDNAVRVLAKKELIDIEGKKNRTFSSTDLGKLTIKLNPIGKDELS